MSSFRSPDDAPDVVSAIKDLYNNRLYTDFHFITRDGRQKYHVHKLIVSIHSPVLSKVLYGEESIEFLQVKYHDTFALQNLTRFLYAEDLVLDNISDIEETIAIADRYGICHLKEICRDELKCIPISVDDVLSVLETAKKFHDEEKENECIRLISENQKEIFTSQQFLGLTFRRILEIFEKIKEIGKMTEATFLRLAITWIDTNKKFHNKHLLMDKVDVIALKLEDYLDIIQDFPIFFSNIEIVSAIKEIRSHCEVHSAGPITARRDEKGRPSYRQPPPYMPPVPP